MSMRFLGALALLAAAAPAGAAPRDSADGRLLHDLFKSIVEIPTVTGRGQVPRMARLLSARLRQAGFAARDIEILPVGETASLIVRYRGTGARAPLLFLAHMDVVEAKRADWERDPFKLHEEGGFLYGRGTSDNKLGVAHLVAAFITLKKVGFRPDRDLILGFSGDEETDMKSSMVLAERLAAAKPEYAINSDSGGGRADASGKPTSFAVQVAEKTFANISVTIRNAGGHSARPRADNAIYELGEVLGRVRGYTFPLVNSDLTRAMLRDAAAASSASESLKAKVAALEAKPDDDALLAEVGAEPRLGHAVRTTCVPTLLEGGHADNALPQSATATINCRIFPGVEIEEVRRTLAALGGNAAAEWKIVGEPFGAPASPANPALFAAVKAAVAPQAPDIPIVTYMTPGATDGKHFRARGIPTYGFSADFTVGGEVAGVHGLNERIPDRALYEAFDFWPRLMRQLAGGEGASQ
ncbi:M20/M25/M40 family metallo-hydrolase [Sphingomonas glaciei]|uniref:M20/M25/M40 family metallo-hydrolase n=1 Tax=Sphingomonas glaciei TaxID=2938948 RepID=A0ABY5MSH9_9SPHN|nr:M20/M25/M40 family metallo-hydrolase [Sphingomonas glaciei]UUR06891.1 M20/M25/M40 family metallo-hydrolase [Sphingomonas glaciei]